MTIHIMIPSRLGSTRLPNKPLADIAGKPMIIRVMEQASASGYAVTVACDDEKIKQTVSDFGGHAVLTDPELPSGSDRIYQGIQKLMAQGIQKPDLILNLQGDEPLFPTALIDQAVQAFEKNDKIDVVTFAHPITHPDDIANPNLVKIVCAPNGKAHYFSREPIPHDAPEMLRHIGFYAYTYDALEAFVKAPVSPLESQERLEQLRGLDIGLNYHIEITENAPIGVDTPEDLEKVRKMFS